MLEGLVRGVLHHGKAAKHLRAELEARLDKEVTDASVIMALRRLESTIASREQQTDSHPVDFEISIQTHIRDFNVVKTPALLSRLDTLYGLIRPSRSDFLNITIGSHEVSITVSDKHRDAAREFLAGEEVRQERGELVALTLHFADDFIKTPGILYQSLRELAWAGINIFEIISTLTELTVVVSSSDSTRGFEALQRLTGRLG